MLQLLRIGVAMRQPAGIDQKGTKKATILDHALTACYKSNITTSVVPGIGQVAEGSVVGIIIKD